VSKKKPPRAAAPKRVKQPAPIELDVRMTIVEAADLHRTLLARLTRGCAVVVDGSRVEEIDTAILQMLVSLWRTCLERGIACSWLGASDALRRSADLVGLGGMLHFSGSEAALDRAHAAA
jgi:anti-anti-sigma regulatory factor